VSFVMEYGKNVFEFILKISLVYNMQIRKPVYLDSIKRTKLLSQTYIYDAMVCAKDMI